MRAELTIQLKYFPYELCAFKTSARVFCACKYHRFYTSMELENEWFAPVTNEVDENCTSCH